MDDISTHNMVFAIKPRLGDIMDWVYVRSHICPIKSILIGRYGRDNITVTGNYVSFINYPEIRTTNIRAETTPSHQDFVNRIDRLRDVYYRWKDQEMSPALAQQITTGILNLPTQIVVRVPVDE